MTGLAAVVVLIVVAVVFFGGLIALAVGLIGVSRRQRRRRVAELSTYAAARGFGYTDIDRTLPGRFTGTPFGRGHSRLAEHILQGEHDGRPVIAFEYLFATGSGDDSQRHRFGVVVTALPTPVPPLDVVRSSSMGTLLDAFRGGDHQVGDPAFDAAYRIGTTSPEFAADVLGPELRAWLVTQQPPLLYLRDRDLVVVGRGPQSPAEIDRRLAFAAAFLDLVPDQVWRRAALGPPLG